MIADAAPLPRCWGHIEPFEFGGAIIGEFDAADTNHEAIDCCAHEMHTALLQLLNGVAEHFALVVPTAGEPGGQCIDERQDLTNRDGVDTHR